jgi:hypothetical protein
MRNVCIALALAAVLVLVAATVVSAGSGRAIASEQPQYCGSCHPEPHPSGWRTAHGKPVQADPTMWGECMKCHTLQSCDTCHKGRY